MKTLIKSLFVSLVMVLSSAIIPMESSKQSKQDKDCAEFSDAISTATALKKKKIIIFSAQFGGGHTAVAKALNYYLKDNYEVIISNIFTEILGPWDDVKTVTLGHLNGEKVYNYLMGKHQYQLINVCFNIIGPLKCKFQEKEATKLIQAYCEKQKPDYIISVVPYINQSIMQAADTLQIPFLLIPTDIDYSGFIKLLSAPHGKNFKLALPFANSSEQKYLKESHIAAEQVTTAGFIIRPEFFEPKDISAIKKEFYIPNDKPVVLVLLGSIGSEQLYTFAQYLAKVTTPAHIIICSAQQDATKKRIDAMTYPTSLTKSSVGFTDRISDLMSIADLFITKSGSVSVCEALYMNLPMILDGTSTHLAWEKTNHQFIERNGFGISLRQANDLPELVSLLLGEPNRLKKLKSNITNFDKQHGGQQVKKLVELHLLKKQNKTASQANLVSVKDQINTNLSCVILVIALGVIIVYMYQ